MSSFTSQLLSPTALAAQQREAEEIAHARATSTPGAPPAGTIVNVLAALVGESATSTFTLAFCDAALEARFLAWRWQRYALPARITAVLFGLAFLFATIITTINFTGQPGGVALLALIWVSFLSRALLAVVALATGPRYPALVQRWSLIASVLTAIWATTFIIGEWVCGVFTPGDGSCPPYARAYLPLQPYFAVITYGLVVLLLFGVQWWHALIGVVLINALAVVTIFVGRSSETAASALGAATFVVLTVVVGINSVLAGRVIEAGDRLLFSESLDMQAALLQAQHGASRTTADLLHCMLAAGHVVFTATAMVETAEAAAGEAGEAARRLPRLASLTYDYVSDSASRLLHVDAAGLSGTPVFVGVHEDDVGPLAQALASALERVRPRDGAASAGASLSLFCNARYRRRLPRAPAAPASRLAAGASVAWMSLEAFVHLSPPGGSPRALRRRYSVLGVESDITVQRSEDEARAREQQARSAVAASVEAANKALAYATHELRAPVHNIGAALELVLANAELPQSVRADLRVAQQTAHDLRELASDLLDASRLRSDAPVAVRLQSDVELRPMIALVAQQLAPRAAVPVVFAVHRRLPAFICSDKRKLRQAITNGLANAVKFTFTGCIEIRVTLLEALLPPGPAVPASLPAAQQLLHTPSPPPPASSTPPPPPADASAVDADASPFRIRIEVIDTGTGLCGADPELLFAENVQGPSASLSALEGSGLGLFIVRKITTALHGTSSLVEAVRDVPAIFDAASIVAGPAGSLQRELFCPSAAEQQRLRVLAAHRPERTAVPRAGSAGGAPSGSGGDSGGGGDSARPCILAPASQEVANASLTSALGIEASRWPTGPYELTPLGLVTPLPARVLMGEAMLAAAAAALAAGDAEYAAALGGASAAVLVLPAATQARRCTVYTIEVPSSGRISPDAAAGCQWDAWLLPAGFLPSCRAAGALPADEPTLLCLPPLLAQTPSWAPAAESAAGGTAQAAAGAGAADRDSGGSSGAGAGGDRALAALFPRVLIADDDAVSRRLNEHFLHWLLGGTIDITLCEDGVAALGKALAGCPDSLASRVLEPGVCDPPDDESAAWARRQAARHAWPYDVLLLDHNMPGKQGDEVIAQLRRLGCDTPAVAITGAAVPGFAERLLHCGFDRVLSKPFTREKLGDVMRAVAAAIRARQGVSGVARPRAISADAATSPLLLPLASPETDVPRDI